MTDLTRDPRAIDTPGGAAEDGGFVGDGGDVVAGTHGQEGPIADRLGRNPANLGDEAEDRGDITHPIPQPGGSEI